MICTKCGNEIYGISFVYNYPKGTNTVFCMSCVRLFTYKIEKGMSKLIDAFIEWLIINEPLITQFNESNDKPDSNRNTSADQTPNP